MSNSEKLPETFRRQYLRAPLFSDVLYEDDFHVLKAKSLNISEGGVLIEQLPHVPEINLMPLMLAIVQTPQFSGMTRERLMAIRKEDLDRIPIRLKCRIVRSFEAQSQVDMIFTSFIGCQFVSLPDNTQELIAKYVEVFAKNVVYLLGLFEGNVRGSENVHLIRHLADLLGYPADQKISILRQKVLHSYQSLESL